MKSEVWLLMGLTGSTCGILELDSSFISFNADNYGALTTSQLKALAASVGNEILIEDLKNNKPALIFKIQVQQIEKIVFPWYTFGGGMNLLINSVKFRFSFLEPQNTSSGKFFDIIANITKGRKLGKQWREALKSQINY